MGHLETETIVGGKKGKNGAAVVPYNVLWHRVSAGLEQRKYNNENNVHVSCSQLELDFKLTQLCQVDPFYPICNVHGSRVPK